MNRNFIRYATGTVFAVQLSKAQVRALVGLSVPEDRLVALLNLPHHATPEALIRKGLVEHQDNKVILTAPGKLVLKLLDEAGLVPKGRAKLKLDNLIKEMENIKPPVKEKQATGVTHYNVDGKAACGMRGNVTSHLLDVTCKVCKTTHAYRSRLK